MAEQQQVVSVEQQLMQFVSGQIKTMAADIAKETQNETVGLKARQLVTHTEQLDKAIVAMFASGTTTHRGRRAQS